MKARKLLFSFCAFLFSVSAFGEVAWMDEEYRHRTFPPSEYYVAFYSQQNEDGDINSTIAKTVAAAQSLLANSIESEVTSETRTTITSVGSMDGYEETEIFFNEFSAAASAHLVNVHVEHYYDKPTNTVFSLAYTKKEDLADFCETKVESNLVSIKNKLDSYDELVAQGYKKEAKKVLEEITAIQLSTPVFISQLISMGKDKESIKNFVDRLENYSLTISKLKSGTSSVVKVNITAEEDYPFNIGAEMVNKCGGILSEQGCLYTDSPNESDYILSIKSKSRTSSVNEGACYAYNDVSLSLKRMRDGEVIYSDAFSVKEGGGTEEKAHRRAIDESSKKICEKISTYLVD